MLKMLEEIQVMCNADKRKNADSLKLISAHMLHDFYIRLDSKHKENN